MRLTLRLTLVLLAALFAATPRAAGADGLNIEVDASLQLPPADSVSAPEPVDLDWLDLLKTRRLDINDSTVRYPRFIEFCRKVYFWAERNFNTYDPEYVSGTGKHGKIRLVSDSWADIYSFQTHEGHPLIMASSPYSNIGIQANYSIFGLSFSIEPKTLITGEKATHKKAGFSFSCARLYAEGYYWENSGGTVIRKYGGEKGAQLRHVPFSGLKSKTFGVLAFYLFNYKKFSLPAAYNLSNYQLKSAGSWIAGLTASFIDCRFDFTKLPAETLETTKIPYAAYRLDYNSINLTGGYSFNWVINKHFLFNTTTLPALGIAISFDDASGGRRAHFSTNVRQMFSLTYTNRQFFVTGNGTFHGNFYFGRHVYFMDGLGNLQISTGIRF